MASFLSGYSGPPITFTRDARATLLHARAAAVASGTSTLEASLIGTPFVMVYGVAPLTWSLGRRLVKVDRFAMVNLIAERDVVPELVQTDFTPSGYALSCARSFRKAQSAAPWWPALPKFDSVWSRRLSGRTPHPSGQLNSYSPWRNSAGELTPADSLYHKKQLRIVAELW